MNYAQFSLENARNGLNTSIDDNVWCRDEELNDELKNILLLSKLIIK